MNNKRMALWLAAPMLAGVALTCAAEPIALGASQLDTVVAGQVGAPTGGSPPPGGGNSALSLGFRNGRLVAVVAHGTKTVITPTGSTTVTAGTTAHGAFAGAESVVIKPTGGAPN